MGDEHVEMAALILELLGTDSDRDETEALIARHLRAAELRGYERGLAEGAERERGAVVKWLRGQEHALLPYPTQRHALILRIESGAHLAANGGSDVE